MNFKEIALNEAIDIRLKEIRDIGAEMKDMVYFKDLVKNVKSYMSYNSATSFNTLENTYKLLSDEINKFLEKIKDVKTKITSKLIDDLEETVRKLQKTLTYHFTQKTKITPKGR